MKRRRVIAWGTGGGRDGLKMIIQHTDLELVGAYTSSPSKVGVDAGALGAAGLELRAVTEPDRPGHGGASFAVKGATMG